MNAIAILYFSGMDYLEAIGKINYYREYIGNTFDIGDVKHILDYIVLHPNVEEIDIEIVNRQIRGLTPISEGLGEVDLQILFVFNWDRAHNGHYRIRYEEAFINNFIPQINPR